MFQQADNAPADTGEAEKTAALTPLFAVFLLGLALTIGLFAVVMRHSQQEELQQTYQKEAGPLAAALGRSIANSLESVASISGLYAASNSVERGEFRAYADHIFARNGTIQALEWIPRVSAEDRQSYETAAHRDGFADFRITERNTAGEMVPATVRREYFPVYFVEPLADNEIALGFDLASNPVRREALDKARDTGKTITTQRIKLVQETAGQFGFLAFTPIYKNGATPDTVEARREALMGFALGVFNVDDILNSAIAQAPALSKLDLYLIDSAAPAGEAFLHYRGAPGHATGILSEDEILLGGYEKFVLPVADRDWLLIFVPPGEFSLPTSTAPWMVAAVGLLMTIFFVLFLRTTQNRARIIGQTVIERTAELSKVNGALVDEMAERQAADKLLQEQNAALQLIHRLTVAGDQARTVNDAIRICLEEICEFTNWPLGHAFTPAEDNGEEFVSTGVWHAVATEGLEDFVRKSEAVRFSPSEDVIGGVLIDGKPRWIADINREAGYARATSNGRLPVKGAFFLPLLADQTVVAVLEFYALEAIDPDEKLLAMMGQIGIQFGHAVERAQAAKKLRKSEEFTRMVIDNMPVVIAYFDAEGKTRFYNQLGLDWFACTEEDLIGKTIDGKIPELDTDMDFYRDRVGKTLAGEPQTFDRTQTYPDGVKRTVTVNYLPHFDGPGKAIGFFCIVQDISERTEIEHQLNQAQKMDAIGQLTGGIAHDFNNILMVTDGYTRRALKVIDDPDAATAALEEVLVGTDRAAQLTKQLLAFSRRQIMEKRVFRIEEAIAEIQALLQQSTGEQYQLRIESHSDGACVETDATEFNQALINLVINARDAMAQGGQIEIATRVVDLDENFTARHRDVSPGRYVEVSVHDHGIGIDAETLEHIFEPFFTTKDQGKGTGLGLAMVYGFAQHSGGTVDVTSVVGEGTIFKIYLPAVDRDPHVAIAEVEQDHHGRGETILLVEDDPALLDIVREMLDTLGYNILTANDGFEAIEVEAEHDGEIDLLLSDVVMPNMGGFEAAEIIRDIRPEIKIVFMSGYPNRAGISNENLPDDCEFLQKPVKPAHLAQTLRRELEMSVPTTLEDQDKVESHDYA